MSPPAQPQHQRLKAPSSPHTVRIRMINTTSDMLLDTRLFIDPVPEDQQKINMTDVAFLIENDHLNKKAVFDLGVRKDFWNYPPSTIDTIGRISTGLRVEEDVPEILRKAGIELESINDIIWSHSHFDHTGDPSLFPSTTALNYGPDISSIIKPGYPENKDSPHHSTNFTNRTNNEISFSSTNLRIGGVSAYDFYGDGSFYLLETLGHSQGHMCGLARTTTTTTTTNGNSDDNEDSDSTWILMGGDVCHFCGDMRPNSIHPLPSGDINIPGQTRTVQGDDILARHPQFSTSPSSSTNREEEESRKTTLYFKIPTSKYTAYTHPSPQIAQQTVNNLTSNFDTMENVFVMLAHDVSLVMGGVLPTLNDENKGNDLNKWFEMGWKEKLYWGWIGELGRGKSNDNKNIVEGFWKGGVRYETLRELVNAVKTEDGDGKGKL